MANELDAVKAALLLTLEARAKDGIDGYNFGSRSVQRARLQDLLEAFHDLQASARPAGSTVLFTEVRDPR